VSYPRRGEIYWVNLDPVVGREIAKRRPGMVVSPDEMNRALGMVILAPVTSKVRPWPTRVSVSLGGRRRSVALDQIRAVDASRLGKRLATVDAEPALAVLREMFA
jgi:mRNA interferase MazF